MDHYHSMWEKRSIQNFDFIILKSVLHVLNLLGNMISITQLTKGSYCYANFLPSHWIFLDLSSRMTIDNAKECKELYYFDDGNVSKYSQIKIYDYAFVFKDSEILLWYYRMGHPKFLYLK